MALDKVRAALFRSEESSPVRRVTSTPLRRALLARVAEMARSVDLPMQHRAVVGMASNFLARMPDDDLAGMVKMLHAEVSHLYAIQVDHEHDGD